MLHQPHYTQAPNDLWKMLEDGVITQCEFVVAMALARLTFGFHRKQARASLALLMKMTRYSKPTILSACNSLVSKSIIRIVGSSSNRTNIYEFVFKDEVEQVDHKPKRDTTDQSDQVSVPFQKEDTDSVLRVSGVSTTPTHQFDKSPDIEIVSHPATDTQDCNVRNGSNTVSPASDNGKNSLPSNDADGKMVLPSNDEDGKMVLPHIKKKVLKEKNTLEQAPNLPQSDLQQADKPDKPVNIIALRDAVMTLFGFGHPARAMQLAHVLRGTASKKGSKEYNLPKPIDDKELRRFVAWYQVECKGCNLPTSPETLSDWVGRWQNSLKPSSQVKTESGSTIQVLKLIVPDVDDGFLRR